MHLKLAQITLVLCGLISMPSIAQIMDFEHFPDNADCPSGASGVTQNGIQVVDNTPYDPLLANEDSCALGVNNTFVATNGTSVFAWCGACGPQLITVTIQRQDSAPFELQSIDFSRFPEEDAGTIEISGYPAGGGSPVTVQHTIDSDAWETVSFDNSFSNLERVEIANTAHPGADRLMDNIVMASSNVVSQASAIPVMGPVAYLMLMTGILFIAGRRTRRG